MSRKIEHYVAPLEETPLQAVDSAITDAAPSNFWMEAWRNLRKNPMFVIAAILILFILFVALFPQVFTAEDPRACTLGNSVGGPSSGHPLGFNFQGCDIFAQVVYGARASVLVGILSTLGVVILGGSLGALAGYYGGWLDSVIARIGDIFFALPLLLGALVLIQLPFVRENRGVLTVVAILVIFGWPNVARITRGAVISVKNSDYITSAKSLGVSNFAALVKHVVPNAIAPVIVIATVNLGIFIVAEATLSFLSIGLPTSVQSWGQQISDAQTVIRTDPQVLLYPSIALSVTVLSFIMLGDAVRDALDPKARKR